MENHSTCINQDTVAKEVSCKLLVPVHSFCVLMGHLFEKSLFYLYIFSTSTFSLNLLQLILPGSASAHFNHKIIRFMFINAVATIVYTLSLGISFALSSSHNYF